MPIYEYKCNKCGTCFEQIVFASDADTAFRCPSCDSTDTTRLMSSFACGSGSSSGGLGNALSSSCSSSGGFS